MVYSRLEGSNPSLSARRCPGLTARALTVFIDLFTKRSHDFEIELLQDRRRPFGCVCNLQRTVATFGGDTATGYCVGNRGIDRDAAVKVDDYGTSPGVFGNDLPELALKPSVRPDPQEPSRAKGQASVCG